MKLRDRDAAHTEILYTLYVYSECIRSLRPPLAAAVQRVLRCEAGQREGFAAYAGYVPVPAGRRAVPYAQWLYVYRWVPNETAR